MGTVTGLTAARMQEIINQQIDHGTIDGSGHLIFTREDGSTFDAGIAKGAQGDPAVYQVGAFTNNSVSNYVRLGSIDGLNNTNGGHLQFLFSGLGGIGTARRGTVLVHFSQRGDDIVNLKAWSWGLDETPTNTVQLFTKRISTYVFELWALLAPYNMTTTVSLLSSWRSTLTLDSKTTVAPSNLLAWGIIDQTTPLAVSSSPTIDLTFTETGSATVPWVLKADIHTQTVEQTQLTLLNQDPTTKKWYVVDANGIPAGPYKTNVSYIPIPGDKVWVKKNGAGEFIIDGAENEWYPLAQVSGVTYNDNNAVNEFTYFQYCVRNGFVSLKGLLALSTVTSQTLIGTLPVGARPDKQIVLPANNSGVLRSVHIYTNGDIKIGPGSTANGYYSLDGIIFPAAGKATWTYVGDSGSGLAFANGWGHYSSGTSVYGKVGFWKDEYDCIWTTGLASGGTVTDSTLMISITNSNFLPWDASGTTGYQKISTVSADVFGGLTVVGGTVKGVRTSGGGNSSVWVSLCGIHYLNNTSNAHADWVEHPTERSFKNSWENYGTGFTTFAFRQRGDGMVLTKGLVKSGSISAQMDFVPPSYVPDRTSLMSTNTADTMGRFDVYGFGTDYSQGSPGLIKIQTGNNGWYSFDSKHWFPR